MNVDDMFADAYPALCAQAFRPDLQGVPVEDVVVVIASDVPPVLLRRADFDRPLPAVEPGSSLCIFVDGDDNAYGTCTWHPLPHGGEA